MKMLIAYDGTLQSKDALRFGLAKAKETGARVAILSVFDTEAFVDYEISPNQMETARKQSAARLDEARVIVKTEGAGVDVGIYTAEGDPEAQTLEFALHEGVDFLLCTKKYGGIVNQYKSALEARGKGETCSIVHDATGRVAATCAKAA